VGILFCWGNKGSKKGFDPSDIITKKRGHPKLNERGRGEENEKGQTGSAMGWKSGTRQGSHRSKERPNGKNTQLGGQNDKGKKKRGEAVRYEVPASFHIE